MEYRLSLAETQNDDVGRPKAFRVPPFIPFRNKQTKTSYHYTGILLLVWFSRHVTRRCKKNCLMSPQLVLATVLPVSGAHSVLNYCRQSGLDARQLELANALTSNCGISQSTVIHMLKTPGTSGYQGCSQVFAGYRRCPRAILHWVPTYRPPLRHWELLRNNNGENDVGSCVSVVSCLTRGTSALSQPSRSCERVD